MVDSVAFAFSETLCGQLGPNFNYEQSELSNRNFQSATKNANLNLYLKISFEERHLSRLADSATGSIAGTIAIDSPIETKIDSGSFELFALPGPYAPPDTQREMKYWIYFKNEEGKWYSLFGFKALKQGSLAKAWAQTTTLNVSLFEGKIDPAELLNAVPIKTGRASLRLSDVAKIPFSFKGNGFSAGPVGRSSLAYLQKMKRGLSSVYLNRTYRSVASDGGSRRKAKFDDGVRIERHRFVTQDGFELELTRYCRGVSDNAILLLHGLTTSIDMFVMPEHKSLTQYLIDNGYTDIWLLDWRGSSKHPYNLESHRYSLDHVIAYDMPAAVRTIRDHIGETRKLHVIGHCIGSLTMACAIASQKVTGISSFIGNSVSLTPSVGCWSKIKLNLGPDALEHVLKLENLGPDTYKEAKLTKAKLLSKIISITHPESLNPSCNMISFLWGQGFPAAYNLENLSLPTYDRLGELFGGISFHLYRHIRQMANSETAKCFSEDIQKTLNLPADYLRSAITNGLPPTLLISGSTNGIFPGSNRLTFDTLKSNRPVDNIEYVEIPNYGHQDIFMGKASRVDVFPSILSFLLKQS